MRYELRRGGELIHDGVAVGRLRREWRTGTATYVDGGPAWRCSLARLERSGAPEGAADAVLWARKPRLISSSWDFETPTGRFRVATRFLRRRLPLTVDGRRRGYVVEPRFRIGTRVVLVTTLPLSPVEAAFVLYTTSMEASGRPDPLDLLTG